MSQEHLYQQELEKQRAQEKLTRFSSKFKEKMIEVVEEVENAKISILLRFIIILAVIADLFGLIPVVGSFIGGFFGVVLLILYFLNGLGRGMTKGLTKKQIRKRTICWVRKIFLTVAEGVPVVNWLPLFTIEALIEYTLSKKSLARKIEKMEKISKQFK